MPSKLITLVSIIHTQDFLEQTIKAMEVSLASFSFEKALIICPQEFVHPAIKWAEYKADGTYSYWILKHLVNFIDTDFCLVQQWDSCIINPDLWIEEFLLYDYIGACWDNEHTGFNGGACLRSKKLLEASSQMADLIPQSGFIISNEDWFISVTARKFLENNKGIKFPSIELARRFSVERPIKEDPHEYGDLSTYKSFMFHGSFNFSAMAYIDEKHKELFS